MFYLLTFIVLILANPVQGEQTLLPSHRIQEISLERTACPEACPVYRVVLKNNGDFHYVGKQFTRKKGRHDGKFNLQNFHKLAAFIQDTQYGDLANDYFSKDLKQKKAPLTILSITTQTRHKEIQYTANAAPYSLWVIEQLIDKILWETLALDYEPFGPFYAYKQAYENEKAWRIVQQLEPIVGSDRVLVKVDADIEIFLPERQDDSSPTEILQAIKNRGVSVSVLLDNKHPAILDEDGDFLGRDSIPWTEQEKKEILQIVQLIIGYTDNDERKDRVVISNIAFGKPVEEDLQSHIEEVERTQKFILDVIRYVALGVALLSLILMVIRPMIKNLIIFPDLSFSQILKPNDLSKMDFSRSSLPGMVLRHTKLTEVNFSECDLSDCNFENSNLDKANFELADLKYANLSNASLTQASLKGANLARCDLTMSDLSNADLSKADFEKANLSQTAFHHAKLINVNFRNANLSGAQFQRADLEKADFTGANVGGVNFDNANLAGCTWVDGKPYSEFTKILRALKKAN